MFDVKNLHYSIKGQNILEAVNFSLKPGKITALLGPNGAGKSTILRLLSKELEAQTGEICMNGKNLENWSLSELSCTRAVMPQKTELHFDFSVLDVVLMGRTPYNRGFETEFDCNVAMACLKEVESLDYAGRSFLSLSSGEQQRVMFARVLAQLENDANQNWLLLDEPISNLDPEHQLKTLETIQKLKNRNVGSFVILHDLSMAAAYADEVILLKEGKIAAVGAPEVVFCQENIQKVFNIFVDINTVTSNNKVSISNPRVS
ncbi:MAG: heme ABC transporter ATP-binding protein [Lentisphaeria bacterium]|nr:heme ABC transporter ATP-binding protein [Lentisphaeria bacterium]